VLSRCFRIRSGLRILAAPNQRGERCCYILGEWSSDQRFPICLHYCEFQCGANRNSSVRPYLDSLFAPEKDGIRRGENTPKRCVAVDRNTVGIIIDCQPFLAQEEAEAAANELMRDGETHSVG